MESSGFTPAFFIGQNRTRVVSDSDSFQCTFFYKQLIQRFVQFRHFIGRTVYMIKSYFKVAWRKLTGNKLLSVINISGLALGITCSLLILLWVQDENSVDGFHTNKDQLYQVYERNYFDGKVEASYPTQGILADELKKVIPEIQYASSVDYATQPGTGATFEAGEKIDKMTGFFAGADYFRMFSFPILQGSASTCLNDANVVTISRKMATIFFGSPEAAIGKTIRFENKEDLKITAVFENIPANSSQQFDYLRSWTDYVKQNDWVHNWGNTSPNTFVQLKTGANAVAVESKIKHFTERYTGKDKSFRTELGLQSYAAKYLHSSFKNGFVDGGRIEYVRLFTIVAIFILLIACINFMNLSTAQSASRAREVGVRKVIGAARSSLIFQFITEAILVTVFSIVVAVVVTSVLLPAFNNLTGKQLSLPLDKPKFWLLLSGLAIITGLIAGSYPAIFLSSFKPVKVLKGTLKFNWKAGFFRQGLVVFQFSLSIIMMVSMIVIYRQVDYIQTKDLGYDRQHLIYLPIEGDLTKSYSTFKTEANKIPGIVSVSKMRNSPTVIEHHTGSISWPGKPPNLQVSFADGVVGYDYVKTMKLQLKEGRDFSDKWGADSASFLINETAVSKIGLKDPIGKTIVWGNHPGTVIGVLKDFHFNSMHQNIEPLIVRLSEQWPWGTILIRTEAGKTREVLAGLQKLYKDINPKFPFTYQFSDLEFTKLYKSEELIGKLSFYFAFLAIFISCLGLFGLAAYLAETRTKEIGVRKVLGASVTNILALLTVNFLKLVLIAFIIASPVAWYVMHNWLSDYQYHINLSWWIIAAAGAGALIITLLTVSFQSIKVASTNPVKSLRNE